MAGLLHWLLLLLLGLTGNVLSQREVARGRRITISSVKHCITIETVAVCPQTVYTFSVREFTIYSGYPPNSKTLPSCKPKWSDSYSLPNGVSAFVFGSDYCLYDSYFFRKYGCSHFCFEGEEQGNPYHLENFGGNKPDFSDQISGIHATRGQTQPCTTRTESGPSHANNDLDMDLATNNLVDHAPGDLDMNLFTNYVVDPVPDATDLDMALATTNDIVDLGPDAPGVGVEAHYPDDVMISDPEMTQKILAMSIASAAGAGYEYDGSLDNIAIVPSLDTSAQTLAGMTDTTSPSADNAFGDWADVGSPNAVVPDANFGGNNGIENPAAAVGTAVDLSAVAFVIPDTGNDLNGNGQNTFGSWGDTGSLWKRDQLGRRHLLWS